jgi:hypothetical protein
MEKVDEILVYPSLIVMIPSANNVAFNTVLLFTIF